MRRVATHPVAPLILYTLVAAVLFVAYSASGRLPSPLFTAVVQLGWGFLLAYWVTVDARQGNRIPCFDFGLFCYLLLPVTLPWYCFWSRGWRGSLLLAALYGLGIVPYVAGALALGWKTGFQVGPA